MPRAGAILIQNEAIALIKRERANELYYVFPGGQMEAGESIEAAVFRELREELGLTVTVGPLVAEVSFRGKTQYYCLATINGGLFGTGDGPEMTGTIHRNRVPTHRSGCRLLICLRNRCGQGY